jgi:hypothetical protein
MREGTEESIFVLDSKRELRAVELGIEPAGLVRTLGIDIFEAARDPVETIRGTAHSLANNPEFEVTLDNVDDITEALEATIALRGMNGAAASILGRKQTARKVLEVIDSFFDCEN